MGSTLDFTVAQLELAVLLLDLQERSLSLCHVACDGVNKLLLGYGNRIPQEPFIRAVLAEIAVLKRKGNFPVLKASSLCQRRLTIVWMDELQVRLGKKFLSSKTQGRLKRRVEAFEKSIETGNTKHVNRQVDKSVTNLQPGIERPHKGAHSQAHNHKHETKKPYAPLYGKNGLL